MRAEFKREICRLYPSLGVLQRYKTGFYRNREGRSPDLGDTEFNGPLGPHPDPEPLSDLEDLLQGELHLLEPRGEPPLCRSQQCPDLRI